MTASPAPIAQELRALLVHDALPAGCIAVPVTDAGLAPHLRPGEFAIVDTADRVPVAGELFLVAWMGGPGPDGREQTQICEAYRRSHASDGVPSTSWWVGSLRSRFSPEERARLVREGRWDALGWSNGPYHDGVLEQQIRGRVVGILGPTLEEPRRLLTSRGPSQPREPAVHRFPASPLPASPPGAARGAPSVPKSNRIPSRDEVTDETMMPLSVAAAVAMAHGIVSNVSAKSLRAEAARDRLVTYDLFGRLHTTLGDIKRMCLASRTQRLERVTSPAPRPAASSSTPAHSDTSVELAALMGSIKRLRRRDRRAHP